MAKAEADARAGAVGAGSEGAEAGRGRGHQPSASGPPGPRLGASSSVAPPTRATLETLPEVMSPRQESEEEAAARQPSHAFTDPGQPSTLLFPASPAGGSADVASHADFVASLGPRSSSAGAQRDSWCSPPPSSLSPLAATSLPHLAFLLRAHGVRFAGLLRLSGFLRLEKG